MKKRLKKKLEKKQLDTIPEGFDGVITCGKINNFDTVWHGYEIGIPVKIIKHSTVDDIIYYDCEDKKGLQQSITHNQIKIRKGWQPK